VAEALEAWPALAPSLDEKVRRVRELERRYSAQGRLEQDDLAELRDLYRWTFDAFQARGIAEAEAEASEAAPDQLTVGTAGVPALCPDPIFIIGAPRSGTSILAWSLAQHTELYTENESDIFFYLLKDGQLERAFEIAISRPDGSWLANHQIDLVQFLAYLGLGLNALFTATSSGLRWVDQTPANTIVVDRLAEMFPGARFLHLLRDGRRVVHSMINFHRTFGDPETAERMKQAGRLPPWAVDFRDACHTWERLTRLASNFCRQHSERAFTVRNERLITDPDDAMNEVLEFLGVAREAAPVQFLRTHRINSSFAPSGRSEHAPPELTEPWNEWPAEQRYVFFDEAGEQMVARGLITEPELLAWVTSTDDRSANSGGQHRSGVSLSGHGQR
jgi:hypothetical protein